MSSVARNETINVTDTAKNTSTVARPDDLAFTGDMHQTNLTVDKKDEEWFEPVSSANTPITLTELHGNMDGSSNIRVDGGTEQGSPSKTIRHQHTSSGPLKVPLEPGDAVGGDIDSMEQSLISLLEDFQSGRMCAFSEDRLIQMRCFRREMEELTACHVHIHKMQLDNALISEKELDKQYDILFRRLDSLQDSINKITHMDDQLHLRHIGDENIVDPDDSEA
ncbi:hypothetical protein AB6A40_002143 [Gnathostoma spinigerum]|uniref:Uncharacterized protein n=1 Tax=Gnathostoma spinigerum TaxID=75299 RepID=A0ABD6E5V3_9BILA